MRPTQAPVGGNLCSPSSWAAVAWSSACRQLPASHSISLNDQRIRKRVPWSPRASAFLSSSSDITRERWISPRRVISRASDTLGLV